MIISISKEADFSKLQTTCSGSTKVTPSGQIISALVTSAGPCFEICKQTGPSTSFNNLTAFKFNPMVMTSSRTPSTVKSSTLLPSTRKAITFVPGKSESIVLQIVFPTVVPNPLSNGSNT